MDTLNLTKLYAVYKTLWELMVARNFSSKQSFLTYQEYKSEYTGHLAEIETGEITEMQMLEEMSLLFKNPVDKTVTLVFFFPLECKLKQDHMNGIAKFKDQNRAKDLILISNMVTPKAVETLRYLSSKSQLFAEKELIFNVTKHQLVPKHTLIVGDQRKKVLDSYCLQSDGSHKLELFPGIYKNDPIVKFNNWQVNDLVEIQRPRPDGKIELYYRVVIPPLAE